MTPHESETEKINRIYVTTLRDGWGDLGHFKDRATANMHLDAMFREQNPEFYILTINFEKGEDHEKTLSQIKDRLSTLPDAHPLNISNLGKTFFIHHYSNKALSTEIFTAEQIVSFIKGPSIIHAISTQVDEEILRHIDIASGNRLTEIYSSELNLGRSKGVGKLKSIVNQGIGLGEDRAGLFFKEIRHLSEEEILNTLNKEGINQELIGAILGVDHPGPLSLEDLKTFSESTLFVPAYVQSDDFFKKIVEYVSKSELAREKRVVFLVTGDKQYKSPKNIPDNCQILNYTDRSIDEKTYNALSNLENIYLSVCSGDKSFEAAISNGKIPLFQMYKKGHSKVIFYEHEFLAVLRKMPVAQEDTNVHGRLIAALSEFSRQDVAKKSDIDEEISNYWKTKCVPELRRYDFFKAVPEIENESIILHKIIYNGEFALAEKIDDTKLAITLFHLKLPEVAAILDGILIERSKKIGAIISEAIRDMRLQEDTTALIVQALCSPQALEAYETGKIKAADLRIATIFRRDLDYSDHESIRRATDEAIKKIQILTSQEALTAYKNGYMQVSDLLQLSVQNICDLISPQAIQAYETGHVKFSNLQNFGSQIIKLLISPELLEIYRDSDVKIEDFIGFDAYRIETLTSPQALAAYKDGYIKIADFHKLKIGSMLAINDLISESALYLYRTQKITVDYLISIEANHGITKALKLLSKEAINAYATGIVKISDLIGFGNDLIEILISPRAIEAYKIGGESALAIIKEFGLDGELSTILLSPKAIELYNKGFLNIEAVINTLTDDQIKAFFKSIENVDIDNKGIIDQALREARTSCPQPTELSSQQPPSSFVRFFTVKYDNAILSDINFVELLKLAKYYYPSKGMSKLIDIGCDNTSYKSLQDLRSSLGDEKTIELLMKAAKIGGDDLFSLVLNLPQEDLGNAIEKEAIEIVLYRLLGKEVIKQEHHIKTEQGELKTLVSYLDRASGEILSSETKDIPVLKLDTQHTITHGFFSLLKTLYGATLAQVDSISEKAQELIQLIVDNLSPEQTDEEVGLLTFLYDLLGTLESGQDFSVPLPPRKNPDDGPGDFGWSSGGGLPDDSSDNGNFMMIGQAANTTGVDLDNRL